MDAHKTAEFLHGIDRLDFLFRGSENGVPKGRDDNERMVARLHEAVSDLAAHYGAEVRTPFIELKQSHCMLRVRNLEDSSEVRHSQSKMEQLLSKYMHPELTSSTKFTFEDPSRLFVLTMGGFQKMFQEVKAELSPSIVRGSAYDEATGKYIQFDASEFFKSQSDSELQKFMLDRYEGGSLFKSEKLIPAVVAASPEIKEKLAGAQEATVETESAMLWMKKNRPEVFAGVMDKISPFEKCHVLAEEMDRKYPSAGISFGYIGNLSIRGDDDRSWRFFTDLAPRSLSSDRYSYGSHSTEDLESLFKSAEKGLDQVIRRALDPQYDEACKVFDWRMANEAVQQQFPGAIRMKLYGGADDRRFDAVITKSGEGLTPIFNGEKLTVVKNLGAAIAALDDHWDNIQPKATADNDVDSDKPSSRSPGKSAPR